jgi:hypothetical protein
MIKGFRIIWARVPKKAILYFVGLFGGVLSDRLYDSIVLDLPFVGLPKLISVVLWTVLILLLYFLTAITFLGIKIVGENNSNTPFTQLPSSIVAPIVRKKQKLPHSKVSIGTLTFDKLAVDILTEVKLEEHTQPDVQNFLNRLHLGDPFCPKCSRPLERWNEGWQEDFAQIGYTCIFCRTLATGNSDFVLSEVHAEVRKNYDKYWNTYKKKFDELTGGHPDGFIYPWEKDSDKQ